MIEPLRRLIEALREELKSYGEMLALLDQQQELVVARAADELFRSLPTVAAQTATIQAARAQREASRSVVAARFQQPESAPFKDLIPLLPAEYRPLVEALVQENNQLLVRVQQRARQNHLLLSRSLELMQSFINSLLPVRDTQVYTDQGSRRSPAFAASTLYEAVG